MPYALQQDTRCRTGVCLVDRAGAIIWADGGLQRRFGANLAGRKCFDLFAVDGVSCRLLPDCPLAHGRMADGEGGGGLEAVTAAEGYILLTPPLSVAAPNIDRPDLRAVAPAARCHDGAFAWSDRLQRLLGAAVDFFYTAVVEDGRVVRIAPGRGCRRLTGYRPEEMAAAPDCWLRFIDEQDREAFEQRLTHLRSGYPPPPLEHRIVCKDGSVKWVSHALVPSFDTADRLLFVDGLVREIYPDRGGEGGADRLFGSADLLLDAMEEGVFGLDVEGRITFINTAGAAMLGYRPRELLNRHCHTIIHHTDAAGQPYTLDNCPIYRSCREQKKYRVNGEVFWCKSGKRLPVEYCGNPIWDGEDLAGVVITFMDISDRQAAQEEKEKLLEQLLLAQKMESMGRFAGGIAHDFNNMLTTIIGYSELALSLLPDDDPLQSAIETVRLAGQMAATLTKQLLAFSRNQALEMQETDLNRVVEEMSRMLGRIMGEDIRVEVDTSRCRQRIMADSCQIVQVLMNLAANARDAMPKGGRFRIKTRDVEHGERSFLHKSATAAGPHVMLTVTDSGQGMSDEERRRAFEPFFTTKGADQGTGLGLATVYSIVKQHGGSIELASGPGEGTTFTILFPAYTVARPVVRQQAVGGRHSPHHDRSTIMVVDDEPSILSFVADTLAAQGFRLIGASNGQEALELAEAFEGAIDLLLTDIIMPGMPGPEMAEAFLRRYPDTAVLFMSGYIEKGMTGSRLLIVDENFLHKPLAPGVLFAKVNQALRRRKEGRGGGCQGGDSVSAAT